MLLTTKLELDADMRAYLEEIGITQKDIFAIENDDYSKISNINLLIKALFTCAKYEDAWNNIKPNLNKLDFLDIFSCPYFQLDRKAMDAYKYMYDNKIIDKSSYMYFEALSGALNDWEFWKLEFENLTTIQILDHLNIAFNNVLVAENINPYEIGLINLTEEQTEYIFNEDRLKPGEKLDFLFAERPSVYLNPETILKLLSNNNLEKELTGYYCKITLEIYSHLYPINDNQYNEFYNNFWNTVSLYASNNDELVSIVKDMQLDTLEKLYSFMDHELGKYDNIDEYKDTLYKICINNSLILMYPLSILNHSNLIPASGKIKLEDYLDDDTNLGMVLSYCINPIFDTSNYIIKYPFPSGCPMVYSKCTNMILIGNKIKPYVESDLYFIDDYNSSETVNDELFKNFNSIEGYKEFIMSADTFRSSIDNFLC